jgi:hypothetical protein
MTMVVYFEMQPVAKIGGIAEPIAFDFHEVAFADRQSCANAIPRMREEISDFVAGQLEGDAFELEISIVARIGDVERSFCKTKAARQ